VRPPEISDVAVEPIGSIDVTMLPGVGTWIRDALRESIAAKACLPRWVETDLRATAAAVDAITRDKVIREYQLSAAMKATAAEAAKASEEDVKAVASDVIAGNTSPRGSPLDSRIE